MNFGRCTSENESRSMAIWRRILETHIFIRCRLLQCLLPGLFQVPGGRISTEQRIGSRKRCRRTGSDRRRGCDRAGERRKELQERAPDQQAAGDMLPLATRSPGIYLVVGPSSRINGRQSTRLIRTHRRNPSNTVLFHFISFFNWCV